VREGKREQPEARDLSREPEKRTKEASPLLPSRQAKVRWCSWLSRQSNTLKVSSSNLDRISLSFAPGSNIIFGFHEDFDFCNPISKAHAA
jgi:hypothetical protein